MFINEKTIVAYAEKLLNEKTVAAYAEKLRNDEYMKLRNRVIQIIKDLDAKRGIE